MKAVLDVLNALNAVVASIAFGILVFRGRVSWHSYDSNQKTVYLALAMYTAVATYFSVQEYGNNQDANIVRIFDIILFLVPNVLIIWSAIKYHRSAFNATDDSEQ